MTDRYYQFYGKTLRELKNDKMVSEYADNYDELTRLLSDDDINNEINSLRGLDTVIYKQAMNLEGIRSRMEQKLYDEDGAIRAKDLEVYLRVLKHFSVIYDKANKTMVNRFMVHK
jgi:hypothetical protein